MSDPIQSSSGLEERDDSPIPSTIEGVRARLVPSSLWLLERLGTGMLFLVVISLIVIQTTAVVSHWYGKQVADQTEQFLCLLLVGFTALGSGYLALIGLRKWRPVAHLPEPVDSPKDLDGSSRLFRASKELMKILFFSCIVVFARPGNPTFLLIAVLATVLYLLWQRWLSPDWGTAIGETFLIFALGIALRIWKDSLQPPVPVKQRPPSAVRLEAISSSEAAVCDCSTPSKKQIPTVTSSGELHDPVLFAIHVLFDADTADVDFRFSGLCPDGDRGSGDRFRKCRGRFG